MWSNLHLGFKSLLLRIKKGYLFKVSFFIFVIEDFKPLLGFSASEPKTKACRRNDKVIGFDNRRPAKGERARQREQAEAEALMCFVENKTFIYSKNNYSHFDSFDSLPAFLRFGQNLQNSFSILALYKNIYS